MFRSLMIASLLLAMQGEATFTVEHGGRKYETRVTDADLQNTPPWPPEQENPPLPARRAIELARRQLTAIFQNGRDWRLHSVTLEPIGDLYLRIPYGRTSQQ